ncbi:MAG TPA: PEGA domain-containing protein, partial [bacterium]|nr:PEGA domain-containing protein [bacterium]
YSTHTQLIKMFLSEARIICNINHENIVKIYDFGKYEEQYFIAMEYVFGQNLGFLHNKLQEKQIKLPDNLILEIAMSVLNGLDHAHNTKDKNGIFLNVVHLDMNPNNILLSYDGKVKVVDFGIASANYTRKMKDNLQNIQGTYGYLSPEQCTENNVDRRSDIYSLGVILYELMTNQPLFKHLENDAAVLNAILNKPIPEIEDVCPEIDTRLADIIMRAVNKDPDQRYSTAAEMKNDLQKVYNSLEFNPDADTLPMTLKKLFPAHFIKMTKILERAQTEYLMDELFKDIGDIEEIDLKEKMRVKKEEEEAKKKKEPFPVSFILGGALVFALLVLGVIALFSMESSAKMETISFFTQPPGAEIFINGKETGKTTPTNMPLECGKTYTVEFKKDDYVGGVNFVPSEKNREVRMKLKKK